MLKKYLLENAGVQPQLSLVLTDNWMEFTLRYVVDVKTRRSTKDHLYLRILDEFDRVGDQARIASTTVQLVQPPPLEVRLERPRQD
jgi:hypothetical protein